MYICVYVKGWRVPLPHLIRELQMEQVQPWVLRWGDWGILQHEGACVIAEKFSHGVAQFR